MRRNLFLISFFVCSVLFGQTKQLDSLWRIYKDTKQADTNRLNAIEDIAWSYNSNNPDTAILLSELEVQLAERTQQKDYQGKAFNTIGNAYKNKSDYPKASEFFIKALNVFVAVADKQGQARCYNNLGIVNKLQSNYSKALEFFQKSLKLGNEIGYDLALIFGYINIGEVYELQTDYPKALEYYQNALDIVLKIKQRDRKSDYVNIWAGTCYKNIGNVYKSQANYSKALETDQNALSMFEESGDKKGKADCLANIGEVYGFQSDFPKALQYLGKSLKIRKEIGDKHGLGSCYNRTGELYMKASNFNLAILYSDSALQINRKIRNIDQERTSYLDLAIEYSKTNHFKEAFECHVQFKLLSDSIFGTDKSKWFGDMKTNFEVEKKESELKAKADMHEAITGAEKKRQRFVIYAVVGMLLIVGIFSIFLFRRFKITHRQKVIIEKQKQLVEEHQKEIVDSITYAKRLQQAILPPISEVQKYFPNSFVLYIPKDIVAGDFYWMYTTNDTILLATADCTGHGVPGALVSVVCSNALNRTVKEFGLSETGRILDKVTELVLETFEKSGEEIKDGMDISLLSINRTTKQVQWSGANNPLWIVKGGELTEIKADKQPIGKSQDRKPFTSHILPLVAGETFYLITDGYADQFSITDKKLMKKKFKELLLSVRDKTMAEQKQFLEDHHVKWKGTMEQTDDVTVIGIKI